MKAAAPRGYLTATSERAAHFLFLDFMKQCRCYYVTNKLAFLRMKAGLFSQFGVWLTRTLEQAWLSGNDMFVLGNICYRVTSGFTYKKSERVNSALTADSTVVNTGSLKWSYWAGLGTTGRSATYQRSVFSTIELFLATYKITFKLKETWK